MKRMLRILIRDGEGSEALTKGIIVAGAYDALEELPRARIVIQGIEALLKKAAEDCPDRKDWRVLVDSAMLYDHIAGEQDDG